MAASMVPFSGSNYGKNADKCEYKGETPCALCGKSTKDDGNLYVHVVEGGGRFATKEEHEGAVAVSESGDMGCYPVGSTCAKKLRKAGVHVFEMEVG